eukprot:3132085-Prymnesium_polylepis.1
MTHGFLEDDAPVHTRNPTPQAHWPGYTIPHPHRSSRWDGHLTLGHGQQPVEDARVVAQPRVLELVGDPQPRLASEHRG